MVKRKGSIVFNRKAYTQLELWKQRSDGRTALLLEGARRVGKSTLVEAFAKDAYASYLLIDFSNAPQSVQQIFLDYKNDLDSLFMYLAAIYGVQLTRRQSVIIFDEVQLFPPARELIKQLVADGRYDYIETGSLISIQQNTGNILIPSEEETLRLDPLDFEEFLWAAGEDQLSTLIRKSFSTLFPLPDALHRRAERLFREYMLVGGMPQVVSSYLEQRDFGAVDREKRLIVSLYRNDMQRFGGREAIRLSRVYSTIPSQLAKHDKVFRLSGIDKNARMREYADAFYWLDNAQITSTCYNADDPAVGLSASLDETTFKSYMSDTGLLSTLQFWDNDQTPHEVYRDILLDRLEVNEGMLTENVVAQQLRTAGHRLFFYSRRDDSARENTMEIDFLITRGYDNAAGKLRVSPIEVKSGKRYRFGSLKKFKAKFGTRVGISYILHPRPMQVDGEIIRLPLYMSWCL